MVVALLLAALACTVNAEATISSKIIGGVDVAGQSWMAALRVDGGNVICGATLIDSTHLLTAAHCVAEQQSVYTAFTEGRVLAYIGGTNIYNSDEFEIATVIKGVWHPDFDEDTYDFDVAVLTLSRPITNRTPIQMATIDNSELEADGTTTSIIGWGTTIADSSRGSSTLQEIQVPIISDKLCERSYPGLVEERMFCAGIYYGGGMDSCRGDSGGPILVDGIQIGITSFGSGCANSRFPGVYVRLSAYTSFIQATLNDESFESSSSDSATVNNTPSTAFTAADSGTSESSEMLIIGASAGGAALISGVLLGVFYYRRKRNTEVNGVGASTQPSAMNDCVDVDIVTGQGINGQRGHIVGDGGV
ncbi:hypothetical protein SARC_09030 [Sphaeroforma arctica JP610]|uniref:Peptidase S1 domain-containing protein n=1 Tax=Sphaeroforma arctica JP610 TaxID=667725 RepID=A0A0L0FPV7_9EUKA|nr:hypothetical protein SARC_09030 [Sphaeroforma arctica JP610]KNC78546.1 hypothetical protein SARC_09030 [Sphaeroforma arctica JP610]|eukprot:XP_014152448.1 hypothetical protein SARC_09030 [Sphaeroforma arctica JP610]